MNFSRALLSLQAAWNSVGKEEVMGIPPVVPAYRLADLQHQYSSAIGHNLRVCNAQ